MSERTPTFAVVGAGARFHVAPSQRAPTVSLAPAGSAREPWARDTFLTFRVISERGGWTTLETLGSDQGPHCTPPRPALRALRLRVHVMSRALAPVTTREIRQTFEDGTSLEVGRGVPVEPLGHGSLYRARLGALSTVIRLEPGAVGTRYQPSEERDATGPAEGSLASGALRAGAPVVGQTGRVHSSGLDDAPVWVTEPRGSRTLVELRPRCAQVRALVPVDAVAPRLPSALEPPDPPAQIHAPYVDVGAPMFWPGGSEAGSVTVRIGLRDEAEGDASRRCFACPLHRSPASRPAAGAVLCFRREHVVDPDAVARGLTGPSE